MSRDPLATCPHCKHFVDWHHVKPEDRVYELESENARLREELLYQWELNHSERCGQLDHDHRNRCYWPLPDWLGSSR